MINSRQLVDCLVLECPILGLIPFTSICWNNENIIHQYFLVTLQFSLQYKLINSFSLTISAEEVCSYFINGFLQSLPSNSTTYLFDSEPLRWFITWKINELMFDRFYNLFTSALIYDWISNKIRADISGGLKITYK